MSVPAPPPQAVALDEPARALAGGGEAEDEGIGRFPGETSCLSLCWAVLDLFIASARGLALTALEHRHLAQMSAAGMGQTPDSLAA
jgi:hypothetical protein